MSVAIPDAVIIAEEGEVKNILVVFKDRNKTPVDISLGWTFEAIAYNSVVRMFTKNDPSDFDLSGGTDGELRIPTTFAPEGKWKLMVIATRAAPLCILKPKFVIEITKESIPAGPTS